MTIVVIGATGTIGSIVVARLVDRGRPVRAVTRDPHRASRILPPGAEITTGDILSVAEMTPILADASAVIFTHGGDHDQGKVYVEAIRTCLTAIKDPAAPIILMSSINVTNPAPGPYQGLLITKGEGEKVVRESGHPYCVIRPGWFDAVEPGDNAIVLAQGDTISTQGVRREHVAETMIAALDFPQALGKTVEVFSQPGSPYPDWAHLFGGTTTIQQP